MKFTSASFSILALALLGGCVSLPDYDYSAFRQSRPASILVLPPVNASPEVRAPYSVLAQVTKPLAESGYYVVPVTLVDETFKQNGLTEPAEIAEVPLQRLHEIFGADAALYIHIEQYGTVYRLVKSESEVSAKARLVDLRSGALLWEGTATASSAEGRGVSKHGPLGMLFEAVLHQIFEQVRDTSHDVAGVTSARLLQAGRRGGMLYGPRSPQYQQDAATSAETPPAPAEPSGG